MVGWNIDGFDECTIFEEGADCIFVRFGIVFVVVGAVVWLADDGFDGGGGGVDDRVVDDVIVWIIKVVMIRCGDRKDIFYVVESLRVILVRCWDAR